MRAVMAAYWNHSGLYGIFWFRQSPVTIPFFSCQLLPRPHLSLHPSAHQCLAQTTPGTHCGLLARLHPDICSSGLKKDGSTSSFNMSFPFNFVPITLVIVSPDHLIPQLSHFCLQLAYHRLGLRFASNQRVFPHFPQLFIPKLNLHHKKIKQKQLSASPLIAPITCVNIIILSWRQNQHQMSQRVCGPLAILV